MRPDDSAPVPAIGLGTWQLTGERCRRAVARALELGYRAIDTAQGYDNEAEVGAGLADGGVPRGDIFVTTKIWPDDLVKDPVGSARRSLERLGVHEVDMLLVHWPSPTHPVEDTIDALREVLERRLARAIGVSNFPIAYVERAQRRAPIACNQVEFHPYLHQRRLMDDARARGVQIVAYSPLARGRVSRDATLAGIGRRHGVSPEQVALRWLLQQGVAAVPKASSDDHLRANLDVFDFSLGGEEMGEIGRLHRGLRLIDPEFGPPWDA